MKRKVDCMDKIIKEMKWAKTQGEITGLLVMCRRKAGNSGDVMSRWVYGFTRQEFIAELELAKLRELHSWLESKTALKDLKS